METQIWIKAKGRKIPEPVDWKIRDNAENCDIYGGLYQWHEMMQYVSTESTQGICPNGWHLPSDQEWKTAERQLGMTIYQSNLSGWRGTDQGSKLANNKVLWIDGFRLQRSLCQRIIIIVCIAEAGFV
jgi:uncharacterized protein (TIGR02145 family)